MTEDRMFRKALANVQPLLSQIFAFIRNMSWRDIAFESSGESHVVMLPATSCPACT
jgi:hypothetical protein